ncbi:MAG: carboxypeptidase regulatory-like domain-containing protein [bacterium]
MDSKGLWSYPKDTTCIAKTIVAVFINQFFDRKGNKGYNYFMQYLFLFLFIAWAGYPYEPSIDKGIVIEGTATISSIASNEPQVVIGVPSENKCYIFGKREGGGYALQNFEGYIAGSVTTPENKPILGATVTVSGVGSITIGTNSSFWFDLTNPDTYTITLEMPGYSFNLPTSETRFFGYENPNKTYHFLGRPIFIEGTVTGDSVSDVHLVLSGGKSATATTVANGYFQFDITYPGIYTIKPEKQWYGFSPSIWSERVDFYNPNPKVLFSSSKLYLKGSITTLDDEPLAGATLTITGDYSTQTTTDGLGSYCIELLYPGTYTIKAEKLNWVFMPESATLNLAKGEQRDFLAGNIPEIATVSPTSAPNTGTCTLEITGKWFSPKTTARLVMGGNIREGSLTAISGTTTISFLFSLYGTKHGTYSLFLTNSYWTACLTDCFYVSYSLGYIMLQPFPFPFTIPIGGKKTIFAQVHDSVGNQLNLPCTWTTTLGTLSTSYATETTLYSYSAGAGFITATCESIFATASFTVIPAASFKITGPGTGTAGHDLVFTAEALSHTGSISTGYQGTARIYPGVSSVTFSDGTASFTLSLKTAGTQTITLTDSFLPEIFGTTIVCIYPDTPDILTLCKSPDTSADVGSLTLFAYLADQFTNPITGAEIGWSILSGTGTITSTSTTVDGTAGAVLLSNKAGEIRVEASYKYSLFQPITCKIFPGSTTSIALYVSPNQGVAGGNFTFFVLAQDSFYNETPGYTGTLHLSSSEFATQTPFLGSKTLSFILKQAGSYTATATLGAFFTQAAFSVSASSQASSLELAYGTPTAQSPFPIDVWMLDEYENHCDPGTIIVYDQDQIFPTSLQQSFNGSKTIFAITFSKAGLILATITNGEVYRSISFYVYGSPTASSIWKNESIPATITVSKNTFDRPYKIEIAPASPLPQNNIGISLSISAFGTDNAPLSGTGTINISLAYPNTYSHLIDGTNIDERNLIFYTYQNGIWIPIETSRDLERNTLYGTTTHLSIFAPAGESLRLKKVPVFPNPYRAWELAKHRGRITFGDSNDNLPSPSIISIFNIAGELLIKEENITAGKWQWQVGNTASGVYLYRIESQGEAVFGKIGIIK